MREQEREYFKRQMQTKTIFSQEKANFGLQKGGMKAYI